MVKKQIQIVFLIFICSIFLISFVSATTISLSINPSSLNLEFGQQSSVIVSYNIINTGYAGQYGVNLLGSPKLISYSGGAISYSENTTTTGTITINVNGNVSGDFVNYINIGDQSTSLPIHISQQQTQSCIIDIFPLTLTNVKIKQGELKTRMIQLSIPSCFPSSVSVSGITLLTDEKPINLGELALGLLQPGNSVNIPIEIDAIDVSPGQYSDTLQLLLYNNSGGRINVPSVGISVFVTQGISPITNDTFSTPPSCTLSAVILNINQTATFTCTNVFQNIKVNPQYNEFFIGEGVDYAGGIYTYTFKPVKFGNTNFISMFTYDGSPVFNPFVQEVKISSSGSIIPGTELKLLFTPALNTLSNGQQTIIQLVDNKTGSLVENPEIYVNAVKLISLNTSDKSFFYNMSIGVDYEMRGKAPGYEDLVQIINITSKPLTITLNPNKEFYFVGDLINITSNTENVSYLLNDVIITSPHFFVNSGEFILKANKFGFLPSSINISVKPSVYYTTMSPNDPTTWKKGDEVLMMLTENSSWQVYFNDTIKNQGIGNQVSFKIDDYGNYVIKSDDKTILSQLVMQKRSAFWNWILTYWYILLIGGFILFIVVFIIRRRNSSGSGIPMGGGSSPMTSKMNYGGG